MDDRGTVKINKLQIFYNIVGWFLIVIFLIIAIFNIVILTQSKFSKSRPKLFGYYYIIAANDNMKGTVNKGDIVFLKEIKENELKVGNIVEVQIDGIRVITKVIALESGEVCTQQNNSEEYILQPDDVINGVMTGKITFIGKLALFTQTVLGVVVLLVIPLLVLIVCLILTIIDRRKAAKDKQNKLVMQNLAIALSNRSSKKPDETDDLTKNQSMPNNANEKKPATQTNTKMATPNQNSKPMGNIKLDVKNQTETTYLPNNKVGMNNTTKSIHPPNDINPVALNQANTTRQSANTIKSGSADKK